MNVDQPLEYTIFKKALRYEVTPPFPVRQPDGLALPSTPLLLHRLRLPYMTHLHVTQSQTLCAGVAGLGSFYMSIFFEINWPMPYRVPCVSLTNFQDTAIEGRRTLNWWVGCLARSGAPCTPLWVAVTGVSCAQLHPGSIHLCAAVEAGGVCTRGSMGNREAPAGA